MLSKNNNVFKNSKTTKQIIVVVFIAIFSIACYVVVSSYNMYCEQTLHRLDAIAKTLSGEIDGDKHEMLTKQHASINSIATNTENPLYFELYKLLVIAQAKNRLKSEISTLVYVDSLKQFFYILNSSRKPYFFDKYTAKNEYFLKHYNEGGMIPEYSDAYGTWLTAMAPIKNSKGEVVGIIEVDEHYNDFLDVIDEVLLHKIAISLLLFIIIAFALLRYLRQVLLAEEEIKKELSHSNELINQHNADMLNSINYAKKIQSAMLPPINVILKTLPESFIFYSQKDIVSGDFYFFKEIIPNQKFIIAACDCTGHGVPGALMSMIGSNFLEHIVDDGCFSPAQILTALNKSVIAALKQDGVQTEGRDGMDVALCLVDKTKNSMTYAGANRPLLIVSELGECIEIKGNKRPIGGFDNSLFEFTEQSIELKRQDNYYLFSDGYVDQFGGDKGKKFTTKRFKSLLSDIAKRPIHEQQQTIEKHFTDWKSFNSQTDDVLVIGFRV